MGIAEPDTGRSPRKGWGDGQRRIVVALLLLATTFAAYSPVHDAGFLSLDDKLYVTDHPRVLAGISC